MKKASTSASRKKEHHEKLETCDGNRKTRSKEKVDTVKKLPLVGKQIYLDIKDAVSLRTIERDIRFLGAKVETFLSREINYVITSQQWTKTSTTTKICSPESPAAVNTPSPFNCGGSPAGTVPEKKKNVTRGKAMVQNARTESKNNVLEMAEQWGAKIVPVDSAKKWLEKEKAKFKPEELVKEKEKDKKEKKKSYKTKTLQKPYVKFEADSQQYRPVYKHLDSWPYINLQTSRGVPPFMVNCPASYSSASEAEDRDAPSHGPKASDNKMNISSKLKDKSDVKTGKKSCKEDAEDSGCLRGIPILTAGDIKRRKEIIKRQKQRSKPGYCECCELKFENLDRHLRSDHHKAFSRDKSNYEKLDCLIEGGPSTVKFLKTVLIRHCSKHVKKPKTKSEPKISSVDEVKNSPRPMGSQSPPNEANVWSPLKRRTKRPDSKFMKITIDTTFPNNRSVSTGGKSIADTSPEKTSECLPANDECCKKDKTNKSTDNSASVPVISSAKNKDNIQSSVTNSSLTFKKSSLVPEHSPHKIHKNCSKPSEPSHTLVDGGKKIAFNSAMQPTGSKSPVFKKSPLLHRNKNKINYSETGSCNLREKRPIILLKDVRNEFARQNCETSSQTFSKDSPIKSPRSGISHRTTAVKNDRVLKNKKSLDFESNNVTCSTPSAVKSGRNSEHFSDECSTPKREVLSPDLVSPVSSVSSEKKYKVLSDRSLIKLLASENDDCQSFKGFDNDVEKNEKGSTDFTYVEISNIDVDLDSDNVSPDEQEDSRFSEESDSNHSESEKSSATSDVSSQDDFKEYFQTINFTSPSKKSASSWGDACEEYLNVISSSNRKLISTSCSTQKVKRSRKKGKKKSSGKSKKHKKLTVDLEKQVDPEIVFNFSSPQKQRQDFSPLKLVGNHVVCEKRKSKVSEGGVSKKRRSVRKVLCVD